MAKFSRAKIEAALQEKINAANVGHAKAMEKWRADLEAWRERALNELPDKIREFEGSSGYGLNDLFARHMPPPKPSRSSTRAEEDALRHLALLTGEETIDLPARSNILDII